MSLKDVRELVQTIIRGKVLIGHGLQNDLTSIGITHPWTDIRDTAIYKPFMKLSPPSPSIDSNTLSPSRENILRPRKLRELALEVLGKKIQVMGKPHCPTEDAIASMDLYKHARNDWEGEIMIQVNPSGNHSQQDRIITILLILDLPPYHILCLYQDHHIDLWLYIQFDSVIKINIYT